MTAAIEFLLNGETRRVDSPSPTLTVLDYLRLDAGARGTKEGCAEGDCGACTVALGELDGAGGLRWRAVNACIALIGQLDGKAVLTVEGLSGDPRGADHPVQQAMIGHHASQCGFCTPGFVMAMFAFHHSGEEANDDTIHDALAGNLCRCTGYRPIVDAMAQAGGRPRDRFVALEARIAAGLKALARADGVALERDGRRYFAPRDADALADVLAAHPRAHVLAGGTDLGLEITKKNRKLDTVVWLGACEDLKTVEITPETIRIGAGVTYTDALPAIEADYPSFATLIRRIGSRQIRNHGTVCGNLANASPIGDTPPALIALDARVILRKGGVTRELALEDFFLDYRKTALAPGEFIAAVTLPRPKPGGFFRTYKISKRYDQDISAVCGAYRLSVDPAGIVRAARVAYGGMAATPRRARSVEDILIGQPWTAATAEAGAREAERAFSPMTDFRASAAYRVRVAGNLVKRLHLDTVGDADAPVLEVVGL